VLHFFANGPILLLRAFFSNLNLSKSTREGTMLTKEKSSSGKPKQTNHTFWTVKSALKLFIILTFAGAFAYSKYQKSQAGSPLPLKAPAPSNSMTTLQPQFSCDGRTHCSQMTSCAEAKYFIQNCPNTKMDGDGDGVPCESQWCN